MGRYYNGDIEGKFWFGVQSSTAPERFGARKSDPGYINYSFESNDLKKVDDELKEIEVKMGVYLEALDDFFSNNNGYNDQMLTEYAKSKNLGQKKIIAMLEDYADYKLGVKIRNCIQKRGYCDFTAEF